MSLILDALKKADSVRGDTPQAQPEEAINRPIYLDDINPSVNSHTKPATRLFFIYGLLLLTLCGMFYFLFIWAKPPLPTQPFTTQSPSVKPTLPVKSALTSSPKDAKTLTQTTKIKPKQNLDEINALYNSERTPPANIQEPTNNVIASLYNDEFKKTDAQANATQIHKNADPNSTVKTTSVTSAYHNVKALKAMPTSLQESIPTLFYTQHQYRANKSASVVLNKRTFYVGDYITDELILEAILKDGIIVKKHTTLFKLQARNSWVNL